MLCSRFVFVKQWHAYAFVLPLPQPVTARSSMYHMQPLPNRPSSIRSFNLPPPKQHPSHSAFAPTCHRSSSIRATTGGQPCSIQQRQQGRIILVGALPVGALPHLAYLSVLGRLLLCSLARHDDAQGHQGRCVCVWGGGGGQWGHNPSKQQPQRQQAEAGQQAAAAPIEPAPTAYRMLAEGPSLRVGSRLPWPPPPPPWPADRLAERADPPAAQPRSRISGQGLEEV